MANATLLYNDVSRTALTTGSSATAAGMGWDMLADPQPRHRARVVAGALVLILDVLSVQSIDIAALISTNLGSAATVRVRMSATDPNVTTSLLYDSGVLSTVTQTYYNGNVIIPLSAAVSVRYIRWDITGTSPIDVGLAPCGLLFRPTRNFSFGALEGRIDLSSRQVNPDTGAEFGVQLPTKRGRTFSLEGLTQTEARTTMDEIDRVVGVAGDLMFIEDIDAAAVTRAQNTIWGGFRTGPDNFATRRLANIYTREFKLVERL